MNRFLSWADRQPTHRIRQIAIGACMGFWLALGAGLWVVFH